jgi:hypothetical protein
MVTIGLYYQRFTPPSFRFSFLNHTLLGYPRHTTTFQRFTHNIKTVKHFRRDSYPIPSYLVPHRHEHFLYRLWMLAPPLILPHQQCFSRIFIVLSTIFQQESSHSHSLIEIVHCWQLSFSTTPIHFFLHMTYIINTLVIM